MSRLNFDACVYHKHINIYMYEHIYVYLYVQNNLKKGYLQFKVFVWRWYLTVLSCWSPLGRFHPDYEHTVVLQVTTNLPFQMYSQNILFLRNQVIHSDPTSGNIVSNQPTTHILHILYSSRSSFWGRHGVFLCLCVFRWTVWEGETKWGKLSTRGVSEREKHQQLLSTYLSNITCIFFW